VTRRDFNHPTVSQGRSLQYSEGLQWAVSVVEWADDNGIALDCDALSLFPGVEVVRWAQSLRGPLTADGIRARFDVRRATAYRWMKVLQPVYAAAHAPRLAAVS